ncbi:MAG: SAM-dependent chlorinase/fluorinase [Gammaproteobacteria bacterium]|jgi:S-adenosylmethionine hydrolase
MLVLFTDFGLQGPYIGQVTAVLQQHAPGVPVVSLFSDLPPFDIRAAAYLLPAYTQGFPPGTVFVCVVDPGVGSARPGVVLQADGRWYVGPNEGLFAPLARRAGTIRCWRLPEPVPGVSPSFHGRDVFAPVAGRLARDGRHAGREQDTGGLVRPDWPDELWRVVYIDRFGNAITGLRSSAVEADTVFSVNGRSLQPARTFSDVSEGGAFWYENANGLVEFAVNRGRADTVLGLDTGSGFSR